MNEQIRSPRQEAQRAAPDAEEVAPGVVRIQMPIKMPGLGHVNCYALEDERGWALVDPGLPGKEAWRELVDRLGRAGFAPRHVHTVVVTHSHVDHFGAAGHLRKTSGAAVVSSHNFRTWWDPDDAGDDPFALEPVPAGPPWRQPRPWSGEPVHLPLKRRVRWRLSRSVQRRWYATPKPSVRLRDADVLSLGRQEWVAVHTPGHTPDHLCLYSPAVGTLLSGDHVLPTITPHISGLDAGVDPLSAFYASLDKVAALPDVRVVLPAHGHPFNDLAGRAAAIARHHDERLARLHDAATQSGEASVKDLSRMLFPRRSWGPAAESETFAHLEHLRLTGRLERRDEEGHLLYRAS